jgi:hypothetical protein
VTVTIPRNDNGAGYVCYARPANLKAFSPSRRQTTQEFDGAPDLDIRPAANDKAVQVCRIFSESASKLQARLSFDATAWNQETIIRLEIQTQEGNQLLSHKFGKADSGSQIEVTTTNQGFYSILAQAQNAPTQTKTLSYNLAVSYSAPQQP